MGLRPPVLGNRPPFLRMPHPFMGNSPNMPPYARFRAPPFPGPFPPTRFAAGGGAYRPQFYQPNRNNNQSKISNQKFNNNTQIDGQSTTKKSDRLDDARKQNPWMTDDLIELMKKKNKANQKWLKNKDDDELKKLARQATNVYTRERNKIKKKYQDTQSDLLNNKNDGDESNDCDNKTEATIITTTTTTTITDNIAANTNETTPSDDSLICKSAIVATNENSLSSCNDDNSNDDIIKINGDKNEEEIVTNSDRIDDNESISQTNGILTNIDNDNATTVDDGGSIIDVDQNKTDNFNNNVTSIEQIALNKLDKLSMKSTVDDSLTISSDNNCVISNT